MDKKRIELIATGVLIVIFVFVLANSFKRKRPPPAKVKPLLPEETKEIPMPPVLKKEAGYKPASREALTLQKERAKLDWGVDPFYHPIKKELTSGLRLVLKGVSIGKGRRNFAFINDEIVGEGEKILGYEVVKVEKDKVLLRKGKEKFYLVLPEEK
ncbi:MAG: hypothetical protein B6D56_03995 [Candidatus Omnitrophica bacterium 4484_70.1]|nr:MAG: hypothetical protein B6D56_03995 [Candidatus Omnitrophica bacterium 4484_70.1]